MIQSSKTLDSILSKLDLAVRFYKSQDEQYMTQYLSNQLSLMKNITENKKEYLAASYYVPGELLELFDVQAVYIERFAGIAAAWRIFDNPALQAETKGFPHGRCSYQAMFHLIMEEEIVPKPVGFTALSFACNDAWTYCKDAAKQYEIPFYYVDITKATGKDQLKYLAQQLEEMYNNLKKIFPLKSSIEEVVAASNEAQRIKQDIDVFRIKNPESFNVMDLFKIFPLYNDLGKKSAIEILNLFKNKIENVKTNDKDLPRVLWLGIIPLYKNSIIKDIEDKLNCRIVCEEMFDFGMPKLSCYTFFEDLARRIISSRFFTWENRTDAIFKTVDQFNIKGIIHFSHNNCRFLPPLVPHIKYKAKEENIPFIEIKGDVVDPYYFDEKNMWGKLKSFKVS